MRSMRLGDVAKFIRGITFKPDDVVPAGTSGAIQCMRTKNVQATLDTSDVWSVDSGFVKREEQFLCAGDLLISSANSWNLVGKCSWIPEMESPATFGGFVSVLRGDRALIEKRYLYHWFIMSSTQATVRSFSRQTTNIANLDLKRCLDLQIPLPSLAEQRRIAAILDQVDALRTKRRQTIALLDGLARDIFLDMFGDPVVNPKGLPMGRLGELGTLDRGVSKHRPRNDPALLGGPYPLIQTGDVAASGGYIDEYKSTYSGIGLTQSRMWPAGTLCITIAANIAKTGILRFPACFPDSVVGFTADSAVVEYVRIWLSFLQKALEASAPESAQKNINLAILRNLPIPVAPAGEISGFAERIEKVAERKRSYAAHLATLDELFTSLQQRAFAGELRDREAAYPRHIAVPV
ncbi:restriction endonuclease subunit S [Streptomyces sp. NPDC056835]|uniref:restriction endonuclease subunit S n=1 Tax=Streptomyces sp. NPDC056835 TaxID=3345956 RepID=UPI0036A60524